jgi:arabinose-5-phosphate isomerase
MTDYTPFAKEVFEIESKSIIDLIDLLDENFNHAIEQILSCKGSLIVSGVGKSGLIGKKIAATLASTGTPSFFLHPVEAFHGDLGMVKQEDLILAISYSGETEELLKTIPFFKNYNIPVISITGKPTSTLATNSHIHLNTYVQKEACPLALAPTSSTTAALAMGDALAVALMKARQFQPDDFAKFHPGGTLGRKLLTTVEHCMFKNSLPTVFPTDEIPHLIHTINMGRLGLAVVINEHNHQILGIITDGDLRRSMDKNREKIFSLRAEDLMSQHPKTIDKKMKMAKAEEIMNKHQITSLLVADIAGKLEGIVQIYSMN